MVSVMLEVVENVIATRTLFESAFEAYLDACSALWKSCMTRESSPTKLASFASNELALLKNHETELHQAKSLIGATVNHSRPVSALPPEILSRIFHLVPHEPLSGDSLGSFRFPKRLEYISHTCSRWRQAAVHTPSLWRSVCFAPLVAINRSLIARATVYATRAGRLPLEIDITEYGYKFDSASLAPCYTEDDLLLEFLASVAHRISSIQLSGTLGNSELCGKALEICLSGATPGVLTRLAVFHTRLFETVAIGSSQDSSQMLDLTLDMPVQRLDDILSSVSSLSLRHARFPWASKALHGLVELRLGFDASSAFDHSEVKIPESRLCDMLLSSPSLRTFALNMCVLESSSSDNPVTPIALEDLEVLDLRGLDSSDLGTVLRLVAPGPKLSIVWLDLGRAYFQDPYLDQDLKSFFARVDTPNLGLTHIRSFEWLKTLRGLANKFSIVALHNLGFFDSPDISAIQCENTQAAQDFTDRLHLSNCIMSLAHLNWILDTFRPRKLTLWRSHDHLDPEAFVEPEGAITMLSQRCPYVSILPNDEPDPVWDLR